MKEWTHEEAVEFCSLIESVAPGYGCHVALTGGCLYREGSRKDCDVILYRIRQVSDIDFDGLFKALGALGVHKVSGFGFCHKATYKGMAIDFLSPEEEGGEYPEAEGVTETDAAVFDSFQ